MMCQCIMKISVTYLNWFKSFGELKFKMWAKICVQICPVFACLVTYYDFMQEWTPFIGKNYNPKQKKQMSKIITL